MSSAAAAAVAQAAAAQLQVTVDDIVTPVVIACFLACILYGILLHFIVVYFTRFGRSDRLAFRLLVAFFAVTATGDTVIDCAWVWLYTVKALPQPQIFAYLPWTFEVYACLTGPSVLLAQAFFTWRLWVISERKNWWLPSFLLLTEGTACGLALWLASWAHRTTYFVEFQNIKPFLYAWLGCGLLSDIVITSAIVYYILFRPRRVSAAAKEARVGESPLTRIAVKTFQTNSASLLVQTLVLAIIVTKGRTMWYSLPGFLESKIYILSVVATLNARRSSSPDSGGSFSSTPAGAGKTLPTASSARYGAHSLQVHVDRAVEVEAVGSPRRIGGGDMPAGAEGYSKEELARAYTLQDLSAGAGAEAYAVRFEKAREGETGVEMGKLERGGY
ncbi:hypothetical protein JCM10450v2_008298 [Rhodotorula kratochvilovae]